MAFTRSAVRSRLAPPLKSISYSFQCSAIDFKRLLKRLRGSHSESVAGLSRLYGKRGRQKAAPEGSAGLDQRSVANRLRGMSTAKAEWYRGRAEDCCRNAIIAEDERRRLHWLEAASRWIRLAREEGVLPLRQTSAAE
jgi:hypothetical protein